MSAFSVGIDLGTTNSAVAQVSLDAAGDVAIKPSSVDIPQVVKAGEVAGRALLPSFLHLPAEVELPAGALALPWDSAAATCIGEFARERAALVPGRVVGSAKSWLCHSGVDRRAALLPVAAPDDLARVSPVEVSARILGHLAEAFAFAHKDTGLRLQDQDVVLTVPASFDPVARALTEEAARSVGLTRLTLLEEPQAALYAWVASQGEAWRKQVRVGDVILVVDLGGGTTDFSLIEVKNEDGQLALSRIAVGDHILLGGDNMDLALAYRVKGKLTADLDDWQMRGLVHGCQKAKEQLLEDPALAQVPLAIAGRGSKLVGGTVRTELLRDELTAVLLDGFLPEVAADARPVRSTRTALATLGLPYAQDAAITRHLAAFVAGRAPTHVLFNGGVTKSAVVRERISGMLSAWAKQPVTVLPSADLDRAVALGAAYYGRARVHKGVRIKGGAARAYYVGIERSEMAVPGLPPRVDAVCIAPQGMEEGSTTELGTELGLVVGEPATFRFFSANDRPTDAVAATVDPTRAALIELPPIEATLPGAAGAVVPVKLQARITEVGTLELAAVEVATQVRHRLEFNIRVE